MDETTVGQVFPMERTMMEENILQLVEDPTAEQVDISSKGCSLCCFHPGADLF